MAEELQELSDKELDNAIFRELALGLSGRKDTPDDLIKLGAEWKRREHGTHTEVLAV